MAVAGNELLPAAWALFPVTGKFMDFPRADGTVRAATEVRIVPGGTEDDPLVNLTGQQHDGRSAEVGCWGWLGHEEAKSKNSARSVVAGPRQELRRKTRRAKRLDKPHAFIKAGNKLITNATSQTEHQTHARASRARASLAAGGFRRRCARSV